MKLAFSVCIMILLVMDLDAQRQIKKFDPALLNSFQDGHQLPNGTHRIYSSSLDSRHWHHGYGHIIDWDPDSNTQEVWYPFDSLHNYPLIASSLELFVQPFPDGSSIVVSNNFDCDVLHTDILFLNQDRSVRWHKSTYDYKEFIFGIKEIGLISLQVLGLVTEENMSYYFSLEDGQLVEEDEPVLYTQILFKGDNIYASENDRLVRLDADFEEIDFENAGSIQYLSDVGSFLIVQSADGLMLFDEQLELQAQKSEISGVTSARLLGNHISLVNSEGLLIVDFNLEPIRDFEQLPYETMNYVASQGDTALVLSTYNGLQHTDFVIREYVLPDTVQSPLLDVQISTLVTPDTVYVDFPFGTFYTRTLRFDTVFISLFNNSSDSIYQWRIECDWTSILQCSDYQQTWQFDDQVIPPFSTLKTFLEPFSTGIVPMFIHGPFCFWVESPNGQPDVDPTNNMACGHPYLTTATNETEPDSKFHIYPNPANDQLFIEVNDHSISNLKAEIYDLSGTRIDDISLSGKITEYSIADFHGGLYIVRIVDTKGRSSFKKFIVQH